MLSIWQTLKWYFIIKMKNITEKMSTTSKITSYKFNNVNMKLKK